jgi:small subunit ribosomal protein S7e
MSATSKIQRSANAPRVPADELEVSIGQALIDLQASVADLKCASNSPIKIAE